MTTLRQLKRKAMKNYNYKPLFFKRGKAEYVIFPKKHGKKWWRKATWSDVLRVSAR